MCEFFGCGYCVLLTKNMLCHVQVMFIQLLNLLERYYVYVNRHHQEVKIVLGSLLHHHTETSEWSKITKIQLYKYEQIVVKFMCEFFGCGYCVLLTINMLCHVQVMFI